MKRRRDKARSELLELVERLCTRQAISAGDQNLLRYLANHCHVAPQQQQIHLSEEAIARSVYEVRWTTKNTLVRVAISRLREDLARYFDGTSLGRQEPLRIELPKRVTPYVLRLVPNSLQLHPREKLWDAYFIDRASESPISIVFTEPLFFFDPKEACFIRYLNINYEAIDTEELRQKIQREHGPDHPACKLEPSYHYQPGGEIEARSTLMECLRQSKAYEHQPRPIRMKVSRDYVANKNFVSEDIVVLGNRRTSWLFKTLQEKMPITVEDATIAIKGMGTLKDEPPYAFAVFTRRRNLDERGVVTMIGANHGRAAEKVAEFVNADEQLKALYAEIPDLNPHEALPEQFQILFRVKVLAFDNPRDVQPVLWWGTRSIDLGMPPVAPRHRGTKTIKA